tara:strand:- start:4084 stop:5139 length:1056 start_codon:yes stop_codon:yes gene_type:complete
MPVERCSEGGKPGFRFGDSGKCYTYTEGDTPGMRQARNKARAQERAAYASGFTGKSYDDTEYDFLNEILLAEEVWSYEEFLPDPTNNFEFLRDIIKEVHDNEMNMPPDDQEEEGHEHNFLEMLDPEERMFANALIAITQKYGKFNADDEGVWVGYTPAEENDNRDIGVKCANCALHESEKVCRIISATIEPGGYCRLAVIPKGYVDPSADEDDDVSKVTYGRPGRNDPRKTPAKPSERRSGSRRNRRGSAQSGSSVTFSEAVTNSLKTKMENHNKKHDAASKRATLSALKAVYRRGAGAFSTSHRPGMTRGQWAMARVNAYLYLLRNGRPSNPNYTTDNDLLPKGHPRSKK